MSHAFDGEGSRLYGSRWNSPGVRVVHASATLSLAVLEIVVNLRGTVPLPRYVFFTAEFDPSWVERVELATLPTDWRASPPPAAVQRIGDVWVRRESSAVLEVPSALIPHERNYVLNPAHPDFERLVTQGPEPLDVDSRVFRGTTPA